MYRAQGLLDEPSAISTGPKSNIMPTKKNLNTNILAILLDFWRIITQHKGTKYTLPELILQLLILMF